MKIISNFKIVTYKNLIENTVKEIEQIVSFLNLKIDKNLIKKCVKDCEFEKLQAKEIVLYKNKNKKSMKFRKGISNDFRNNLDKHNLLKINNEIKNKLNYKYKKILNLKDI